jgi:hypothetical protein
VLTIAYAPLVETILSTFSCRQINGEWRLMDEPALLCQGPDYEYWYRVASFWTFFYVCGIPFFNLCLLHYYRVPALARELTRTARLRSAIVYASLIGIKIPPINEHEVFLDTVPTHLIDALYIGLILHGEHVESEEGQDNELPDGQLLRTSFLGRLFNWSPGGSCVLSTRKEYVTTDRKKKAIISLAARELTCKSMVWMELRAGSQSEKDFKRAKQAIGPIFEDFYSHTYFWSLMEAFNKHAPVSVTFCLALTRDLSLALQASHHWSAGICRPRSPRPDRCWWLYDACNGKEGSTERQMVVLTPSQIHSAASHISQVPALPGESIPRNWLRGRRGALSLLLCGYFASEQRPGDADFSRQR